MALIDRGGVLVGDDGVGLEPRTGRLWAFPPPTITGLLEIRNVGIVNLPCSEAPVALVIQLDADADRHIEAAETVVRAGVTLPMIRLSPNSPIQHLKAEWALKLYGLT